MPSNVELFSSPPTSSPLSRTSRDIARVVSGAELSTIRLAATAHVEQARLDAVDHVASRALQGVAMVSQLEQQLSTMVPFATSRLQAIGDMHAFAVANEVASFSRRLS